MATSLAPPLPLSGGLKKRELLFSTSSNSWKFNGSSMAMKSNRLGKKRQLSVRAKYSNDRGGGGADFVAGFLLGGAVFGTIAYIFAPQIRRTLLNENEYGFRKARRPIYYDEDDGLEKTRQTLNAKLGQLNAAIDNVSSRLLGGNKMPPVPAETDPEVEAKL